MMVEFINKLTESQASERVRKVLRSDADKKREQRPNDESKFEDKEEKEEPKDEVILAGTNEDPAAADSPEPEEIKPVSPDKNTKNEPEDIDNEDGHIDVTA